MIRFLSSDGNEAKDWLTRFGCEVSTDCKTVGRFIDEWPKLRTSLISKHVTVHVAVTNDFKNVNGRDGQFIREAEGVYDWARTLYIDRIIVSGCEGKVSISIETLLGPKVKYRMKASNVMEFYLDVR